MSSAVSPRKLLEQLVAIPSVSSQSNGPLIDYIERFFRPRGWHMRFFSYQDATGVEKRNLIVSPLALAEGTVEVDLAIVCHTDTVPYSSAWLGATELCERNGMLHGCGACDVKGFLACVLAATSMEHKEPLARPFCLVFTADEEVGCRGARFLYEQRILRARYAIVGEPTSLVPARAGKGYCLAMIRVRGRAAHSAFPEAGDSAIFAAARLLREIEALAEELASDRDEAFSPPFTTLNIGEIQGGTAKNVVPAECSFLLEWRPIPRQRPELLLERLRRVLDRLAAGKIEAQIEVLRMDAGFETIAESAVIDAVRKGPETQVQTIAFGTEAPWMARMGADVVVIGPGSMLTAHSSRECVPEAELDDCVHLLHTAIERICG